MRQFWIKNEKGEYIKVVACLSTGKKDKNGREVFEGDILQDLSGDRYIVYWEESHCGLFKKPILDDHNNNKAGLHGMRFWEVVESLSVKMVQVTL